MSQTLFQERIQELADEAEDFLPGRRTGVECEYALHEEGAPFQAVIIVGVDTDACCGSDDLTRVSVCWPCATKREGPYRDRFQCACRGENSVHESKNLKFAGVLQATSAPEPADA